MRLYNQDSCTPVVSGARSGPASGSSLWSPPISWVPKTPQLQNPTTLGRRSMSLRVDQRDDRRNSEHVSSPGGVRQVLSESTSFRTPTSRGSRGSRENSSPLVETIWPSSESWKEPLTRLASWSLEKGTAPILVVSPSKTTSPAFQLKRRESKKENRVPATFHGDLSKFSSMSMTTEIGDNMEAGDSPGNDSTDDWLDFSLDEIENPFQDRSNEPSSAIKSRDRFTPIVRSKGCSKPARTFKPKPIRRTRAVSPMPYPMQHCQDRDHFLATAGKGSSAFVLPKMNLPWGRSETDFRPSLNFHQDNIPSLFDSPSQGFPPTRSLHEEDPFESGSSHDRMSPATAMSFLKGPTLSLTSDSKSEARSKDVFTYSCMLKSGVPFQQLRKIMERDGFDPSIIELASLSHAAGRSLSS